MKEKRKLVLVEDGKMVTELLCIVPESLTPYVCIDPDDYIQNWFNPETKFRIVSYEEAIFVSDDIHKLMYRHRELYKELVDECEIMKDYIVI